MKVYVIHENPDWYAPLGAAFDAAGVPHEQWLLGDGVLDLDSVPPDGVFWSRMSASAHTRGHPYAKDLTRGTLCWLESHGRPGGQRPIRVLELEMSKMDWADRALRAAGFDVPRTVAVAGLAELPAAARKLPVPFISKHNQGGRPGRPAASRATTSSTRLSVRARLRGTGRTGLPCSRSICARPEPFITRVEVVGGEFIYAITADTARGGFELCPADALRRRPGARP